ncbi:MAG: adenylate kinase [Candidatus Zhuqueibacterota bacterium]
MILIMLGAPGTGKGTQGKILGSHYRIPNISTGDILRTAIENDTDLGKQAKQFMDKGELVPDDVMIGMIDERLLEPDCKNGFILDGFPRTVAQAQALDKYFQRSGKKLDAVIGLELSEDKIVARLTSRRVCRKCGKDYNVVTDPPPANNRCIMCGGVVIQRADDNEKTVRNRLNVYYEKTRPLQDYYQKINKLHLFHSDGAIEDIQRDIRMFLDNAVK